MIRLCQPLRQGQAAARAMPFGMLFRVRELEGMLWIVENRRNAGDHCGARSEIIAALQNVRGGWRFGDVPSSEDVVRFDFRGVPLVSHRLNFGLLLAELGEALLEF